MRTIGLTIDAKLSGRTVQSVLERELGLSSGLISRLKRRPKGICINGRKVYTTARVQAGETLTAEIDDIPALQPKTQAKPVPIKLSVLYEDEDLLMIDKPAGIAVHADSRRPEEVTLENALAAYLPDAVRIHPVSRLDRGTSGIMTYAKNGYVHELLRRMLHTEEFRREYRGICVGKVTPAKGRITDPIGFAEGSTYRRSVVLENQTIQTRKMQDACTEYQVLETGSNWSLLRLVPYTGRTHQLRVHMASRGYPLAGDWLYGNADGLGIQRPALHSYELWLKQPLRGEQLHLIAPMPEDMLQVMRQV